MPKSHQSYLAGRKFGLWSVLREHPVRGKNGRLMWECVCECGTERLIASDTLNRGATKSCGCVKAQWTTTHGMKGSPTYASWTSMKQRCTNPKGDTFGHYGGRGIKICGRWLESFENFLADMGVRPDGTTLDRKDVNGDYEKENCRWATSGEQADNKRTTVRLSFNGETKTRNEWAKELGIPRAAIRARLDRGWSAEDTLTKPLRGKNSDVCLHGHPYTDGSYFLNPKGVRVCRECTRAAQRRYRERKAGESQ